MDRKRDLRVYVRGISGLSVERQVEIAHEKGGLPRSEHAPIYIEKQGQYPVMRDGDFWGSLRETKKLGRSVVGVARLPVIANTREELTDVMARLKDENYKLVELETGYESDGPGCGVMILMALRYFASKVKTFAGRETAIEAGKRGGKEAARRRRAEQNPMPIAAAMKIWTNTTRYPNEDAAVAAIDADTRYETKLSRATWRRRLGKRGGKVGRRPSPRQ